MSLVVPATPSHFLSAAEAQRLTQRIKLVASGIRDSMFKLRSLVNEAKSSNVWQVLGFASWTAYLADTLGSEPMRLGREERQELVAYLSGEGMSTRAIAGTIGVSKNTVTSDIKEVSQGGTPEPEPEPVDDLDPEPEPSSDDDWVMADPVTGEIPDGPVVTEHTVTEKVKTTIGLDGKTYTASSKKPPRRPLPKQFLNAVYDLDKVMQRLGKLTDDDRFKTNRAELSAMHGASLARSATTLARVIELLN